MDNTNYYSHLVDDIYRMVSHRKFKFPENDLNRRQQLELLEAIKDFYEESEDYIKCAKMRDIIKVQQSKKIRKIVTK